MSREQYAKGTEFEEEVRTVARAYWPCKPGEGAPSIEDGRERDSIFYSDELVHYIECTTERTLSKLKNDSGKMVTFRAKHGQLGKLVKLWFVTLDEPTAEMNKYGKEKGIEVLSCVQFRKRIIDTSQYLHLRHQYRFGSATDPFLDDSHDLSRVKYLPVSLFCEGHQGEFMLKDIAQQLIEREHVLLLGDFGMGKSLFFYMLFCELERRYKATNGASPVPIAINLRDHWGHMDYEELLERHAKKIGMSQTNSLIRAFRAQCSCVLIDGFDEIGAIPFAQKEGMKVKLPAVRREALSSVRSLIQDAKGNTGLLVSGREHFFNNRDELLSSLGLSRSTHVYHLKPFSQMETEAYLRQHGDFKSLPVWLPRRPLFLADLLAKGHLQYVTESSSLIDPGKGWDSLLDMISEREAKIHKYLDKTGIRLLLETLASKARSKADGLGPVEDDELADTFMRITGAFPDDSVRPLLGRLPGLSTRDSATGSRQFLDDALVNALRAGDVVRFIQNPYTDPGASKWQNGLNPIGVDVCVESISKIHECIQETRYMHAINEALKRHRSPTLAIDILHVFRDEYSRNGVIDFSGMYISGGDCFNLDLTQTPRMRNVLFESCTFEQLEIEPDVLDTIEFKDCFISAIISSVAPDELLGGNTIDKVYSIAQTNADILRDDTLPIKVRLLATVLRKLYLQVGQGRHENALNKGIETHLCAYMPEVLRTAESEGLVFRSKRSAVPVYHPCEFARERVDRILENLTISTDSAVVALR